MQLRVVEGHLQACSPCFERPLNDPRPAPGKAVRFDGLQYRSGQPPHAPRVDLGVNADLRRAELSLDWIFHWYSSGN